MDKFETATRKLLASSLEEYGRLCIDFDRLAKRKEEVLQHIAALQTSLQVAEREEPKPVEKVAA